MNGSKGGLLQKAAATREYHPIKKALRRRFAQMGADSQEKERSSFFLE
jgi:hypothetical protein